MAMRSQLRLMIMDARSRDLLGRLKLRRIGPLGEQPPPGAVRTKRKHNPFHSRLPAKSRVGRAGLADE